jgi:hypothetical protein
MRALHVPVLACLVLLAMGAQRCDRDDPEEKIKQIRRAFQRRDEQRIAFCEKKRSLPAKPLRSEPLRIADWTKSRVSGSVPIRSFHGSLDFEKGGRIVVEVLIDEDGCARQARVLQNPSETPDAAVEEAFRRGVFWPATLDQRPVSVIRAVAVEFVTPEPGVLKFHDFE